VDRPLFTLLGPRLDRPFGGSRRARKPPRSNGTGDSPGGPRKKNKKKKTKKDNLSPPTGAPGGDTADPVPCRWPALAHGPLSDLHTPRVGLGEPLRQTMVVVGSFRDRLASSILPRPRRFLCSPWAARKNPPSSTRCRRGPCPSPCSAPHRGWLPRSTPVRLTFFSPPGG